MKRTQNEIKFPFKERNGNLTLREREILFLMTSGFSNKTISDDLRISPHTVGTHITQIYKKTKANNRFQAALWALKYL